MKINSVKTAIRVGQFELNNGTSKSRLSFSYDDVPGLKDNAGRVYLIVVNGEVKKIGGSVSKGGIKSTLSFYVSANTGRPSIRSYGINQLVYEHLVSGDSVEIYMITSEQVKAPVKGLFDTEYLDVSAFKEMEEKCLQDYVSIEGKFPDWNYQEAGKPWEKYIQEQHAEILTKSAQKI